MNWNAAITDEQPREPSPDLLAELLADEADEWEEVFAELDEDAP
jgi:hypothetical protein